MVFASIIFFVPGEMRGKQRHRSGQGRTYTPQQTVDAERMVGWICKKAMGAGKPLEGPLALEFVALYDYPASWSAKRKRETKYKTSKPDLDNIEKLIEDSLKKIAWLDDAQIARVEKCKRYAAEWEEIGCSVRIYQL